MERVTYRIPLNIAHVGYQRCIQGIYTGEALSRRIIITLTQNGSVYELPTDTSVTAYMYVLKPNASEPSINACVVDGETNTITYDISQADIETAGIVAMQLKVVESTSLGAVEKVLVAPKFTMEVEESDVSDSSATSTTTYTALTTALAKANAVYDSRLVSITTNDDHNIVFTYADGSSYESSAVTDALADVEDVFAEWMDASEAWAVGTMDDVPVTSDYEQYHNNSKYYSELASESASDAALSAVSASQSATNAATSATSASTYASQAYDYKEDAKDFYDDVVESVYDSEAWAKGTRNGVAVAETDETYHNNAAYYASQASGSGVAVKYEEQDKSEAERLIARTNIGAITENDVRIDKAKDASLTSVQNGQILTYNSTSGKWENTDIKLSKATDAYLTNMQDGQAIVYDASSQKWKNKDITPKYPLADVTDVEVVSGNSAITITWTNPSDVYIGPTKVAQLDQIYIYRNGVLLGTVPGERYVDDTMTSGIVYTYTLKAHATNGLLSAGVSVEGACGFTIKDWASKAGLTYTSLADITETDMRTLMTKHASCDYLVEAVESDSSVMTDFIANTYAMKWIGLRDYICDKLMYDNRNATSAEDTQYVGWSVPSEMPFKNVIKNGKFIQRVGRVDLTNIGWALNQSNYSTTNPISNAKKPGNDEVPNAYCSKLSTSSVNSILDGTNDNAICIYPNGYVLARATSIGSLSSFTSFINGTYLYYELATYNEYSFGVSEVGSAMLASSNWEYILKDHVPIMTSNTAPYGTVFTNNESVKPAYNAFDGDYTDTSKIWGSGESSSNDYLGYTFTNPICVKSMDIAIPGSENPLKFKVQGSNDGFASDINNLAECTILTTETLTKKRFDISNDNYYTSYRIYITSKNRVNPTSGRTTVIGLQFYGRSLNVSVPTMTSNTAPYGEAIFSSYSASGREPYKVFDKDETTVWSATNNEVGAYIGYKFNTPVCCKGVYVYEGNASNIKIQASNNGSTWVDVSSEKSLSIREKTLINLVNETSYLYYRVFNTNNVATYSFFEINFFGLDYSERTDRTYLYDHGVEVVPFDVYPKNSYIAEKYDDYLWVDSIEGKAGMMGTTETVDVSTKSLYRAIIGDNAKTADGYTSYGILSCSSARNSSTNPNDLGYAYIEISALPNNASMDISSINQSVYLNFYSNIGARMKVTELWLE